VGTTRIQDLKELPLQTRVNLACEVTFVDGPGERFWIEDERGAIPIATTDQAPVQSGWNLIDRSDEDRPEWSIAAKMIEVGAGREPLRLRGLRAYGRLRQTGLTGASTAEWTIAGMLTAGR
jgi:hypothetical protein